MKTTKNSKYILTKYKFALRFMFSFNITMSYYKIMDYFIKCVKLIEISK